mgnify:CR=1 FL=1
MSSNLNRNQHSVYILTYHLVLVIKYRRKVINEDIFDSLMVIFDNIGFKYGIVVKEANWEVDHIHILFEAKPSTNLVKFINSYKSASSRLIKKTVSSYKKKSFMEKCILENRLFYYNNWWSKYMKLFVSIFERQREK